MRPLLLCVLFAGTFAAQLGDWDQYQLIWQDEFDFLDLSKWDHEITAWGSGNSEFQVYTPDANNSYVQNGLLYLRPTPLVHNINPKTGEPFGEEFLRSGTLDLTDLYGRCTMAENFGCTRTGGNRDIPPIASARLRSAGRFSFRYGRAEIRAKMPVGDWMWPAIWLLPENWVYGNWPASGEIDIIETIANRDLRWRDSGLLAGTQHMGAAVHWGPSPNENRYFLTANGKDDVERNFGDYFHDYVMDWSEDGMSFFVDGEKLLDVPNPLIDRNPDWKGFYDYGGPFNNPNPGWNTTMSPFDQKFHFLLNVAVGGTNGFMPDDDRAQNRGGRFPKPWSNNDDFRTAIKKFWEAKNQWYWTWDETEGDNSAMQVDYVRVYSRN